MELAVACCRLIDVVTSAFKDLVRVSVALAVCLLAAACQDEPPEGVSSSGDDHCRSHYDMLAKASTESRLESELLSGAVPNAESLRTQGVSDKGRRVVDLLNAKGRRVWQVEVWERSDGDWVAGLWLQCID